MYEEEVLGLLLILGHAFHGWAIGVYAIELSVTIFKRRIMLAGVRLISLLFGLSCWVYVHFLGYHSENIGILASILGLFLGCVTKCLCCDGPKITRFEKRWLEVWALLGQLVGSIIVLIHMFVPNDARFLNLDYLLRLRLFD